MTRRPLPRPILCAVAALALGLATAAPAAAGWFPADTVDGPSPDILALGEMDLARDGTGGLVYVKSENGVPHVFLSRFHTGAWQPPERVDSGIELAGAEPVIAAGSEHRLLIAWVSGGKLFGAHAPGGAQPGPLSVPQLLHDAGPADGVRAPHADVGINGTGYVVYTAPGAGGSDVRAIRLHETTWQGLPQPLDVAPEMAAGAGAGRARVAVAADGAGVAVWGEEHPDGRHRVHGRRLFGTNVSTHPQEISLPEFEGGAGGHADSPDVDIEDDSSFAWAVWRQDFGDRSRAVARRLVGSLFEAPAPVDAGGPATTPRVAMGGRGVGIAAAGGPGNAVQASLLERDVFGASLRVDSIGSAAPPVPVVGASDKDQSMVAWRAINGEAHEVRARHRPAESPYDPEVLLSRPEWGPAAPDALDAAEDRVGDFAVAFLQGGAADRRLVVAQYDRHPGMPVGLSSPARWRNARPTLTWRPGVELWGPQIFRVSVDGRIVAETTEDELRVPVRLSNGIHSWQVDAVDRRGQVTVGRRRSIRVDGTAPRLRVAVRGARRRGSTLAFRARASDAGGSKLKRIRADFGDGTRAVVGSRFFHRYSRSGSFVVRITAVDGGRNTTTRRLRLRIRG